MKTKSLAVWPKFISLAAVICLGLMVSGAGAADITLWASGNGDGTRAVDPITGPDPYVLNSPTLETYNFSYMQDYKYQEIYIEIPISQLRPFIINSVTLVLDSLGFFTPTPPGSALVYHLVPVNASPTGNIAVDQPHTWGSDQSWELYNSGVAGSGDPGLKTFDVTNKVKEDVRSGYDFSTFKIKCGSRDNQTNGTIYGSETTGRGPRITVTYTIRPESTPAISPLWND